MEWVDIYIFIRKIFGITRILCVGEAINNITIATAYRATSSMNKSRESQMPMPHPKS